MNKKLVQKAVVILAPYVVTYLIKKYQESKEAEKNSAPTDSTDVTE